MLGVVARCRKNYRYLRQRRAEDMNVTGFLDNFIPHVQSMKLDTMSFYQIQNSIDWLVVMHREYCKSFGIAVNEEGGISRPSFKDSITEDQKQELIRRMETLLPVLLNSEFEFEIFKLGVIESLSTSCDIPESTYLQWLEVE